MITIANADAMPVITQNITGSLTGGCVEPVLFESSSTTQQVEVNLSDINPLHSNYVLLTVKPMKPELTFKDIL